MSLLWITYFNLLCESFIMWVLKQVGILCAVVILGKCIHWFPSLWKKFLWNFTSICFCSHCRHDLFGLIEKWMWIGMWKVKLQEIQSLWLFMRMCSWFCVERSCFCAHACARARACVSECVRERARDSYFTKSMQYSGLLSFWEVKDLLHLLWCSGTQHLAWLSSSLAPKSHTWAGLWQLESALMLTCYDSKVTGSSLQVTKTLPNADFGQIKNKTIWEYKEKRDILFSFFLRFLCRLFQCRLIINILKHFLLFALLFF